jgi:hypothetical protein
VALLVGDQRLEQLLRLRIGLSRTGLGGLVVVGDALGLHRHGLGEDLLRVDDLRHRLARSQLDLALQVQDALGQAFDVHHLLDGRALEEQGQRLEPLVVQVEVEVHVLVDGGQLVRHGGVQQLDALRSVHGVLLGWPTRFTILEGFEQGRPRAWRRPHAVSLRRARDDDLIADAHDNRG